MRGHIKKRAKGSWSIVIDLGRDATGKRKQKWHTVKGTKKEAEAELNRILNEINSGEYVEPSRMLVRDYLQRWLKDYAEPTVSPKTYERYAQVIRDNIDPTLGNYHLSKLKPLHIQSFYTDSLTNGRKDGKGGLAAQTVLHFHRLLHKAFSQAVKWQLLARNPVDAVEPPRPERREMNAIDETDTAQLLEKLAGSALFTPVLMAVTTGLRRGEILALRWKDVDFDEGRITVNQSLEQTAKGIRFKSPKTERSRRQVPLPSVTLDVLKDHKRSQNEERLRLGPVYQNQDIVFPRPDGSPTPPDSFSTRFADFIRRSGLKHIRLHDLRHSHATQLLLQGVHPKIVSERLGHSNIGITLDTYSHVLPGMQEDAVLKIDASLRLAIQNNKPK
ncbi:MAG: site-specific integrase [Alphaproteobacteria bacterium]|jgi:integrase|nr:site-specific integrase [Alphaproteobacteria bacterium]MBT7748166.1 site-specific integrase [Alphaproteobacteria bacterium]